MRAGGGSKPDPHTFCPAFALGILGFSGWVQPPQPRLIFTLVKTANVSSRLHRSVVMCFQYCCRRTRRNYEILTESLTIIVRYVWPTVCAVHHCTEHERLLKVLRRHLASDGLETVSSRTRGVWLWGEAGGESSRPRRGLGSNIAQNSCRVILWSTNSLQHTGVVHNRRNHQLVLLIYRIVESEW